VKKLRNNFLDLYVSSYTTTLQALVRARRNQPPKPPTNLLIVSQPNTPGAEPLEFAIMEAVIVERAVSSRRQVEILSSEDGTRTAVESSLPSNSWIHFICHGVSIPGQPFDSYLSLYDGHLTLRSIIKTNLPHAEFAFLSACHSAEGDRVLQDEALHLAAAMQFAGFRSVVGTLWAMVDDDGPELAEVFYREMVEHESKHMDGRGAAVALREGIKHLRNKGVPVNRFMRFVHIGI